MKYPSIALPFLIAWTPLACSGPEPDASNRPHIEVFTQALTTGAFFARHLRMNVLPSCKHIAELELRRSNGSVISIHQTAASPGSVGDATEIYWPVGAFEPGGHFPMDWVQFETQSGVSEEIAAIHFVVLNHCTGTNSGPVTFSFDAATAAQPTYPEDFVSVQADTAGQTSANEIIDLTEFSTHDYRCASAAEGTSMELTCPPGEVIVDIAFATWGDALAGTSQNPRRGFCAMFAMDLLTARCLGHASCTVLADDATMGRDYELCGSAQMNASFTCQPGQEASPIPGDLTARWLKLHLRNTEGDAWGRFGLADVRVYDAQNQLIPAVVVDQSFTDHTSPAIYGVQNAVDGQHQTLWVQGQNQYPDEAFLTLDFGQEVTLSRVELDNLHDGAHLSDSVIEDINEIQIELKKPGVPLWTVLPYTAIAEDIVSIDLASGAVTAPHQDALSEVMVITQSSEYSSHGRYAAEATIDDSEHSRWSAAHSGTTAEHIIYDLGGITALDYVRLDNFHTPGNVTHVGIQVSTTGLAPADFTMAVPATAIGRDFIDILVDLPARYVKLDLTGNGNGYLELAEVDFFGLRTPDNHTPIVHTVPGPRIEAEDFADMYGIAFEAASEGGLNAGWLNPGDHISFHIDGAGGSVFLRTRIATPNPGAFRIRVDEAAIEDVSFSATGGWQTWDSVTSNAFVIAPGPHVLTLEVIAPFNLNWLELHDTTVNECSAGLDNCAPKATCTDQPVEWSCACNPGYSGDGIVCMDIDECGLGTDNCATAATCTNTPGSFTCLCPAGWVGNGTVCQLATLPSLTSTELYTGLHAFRWNSQYARHHGDYDWGFYMSADHTYVVTFEDPVTADAGCCGNSGSINPYLYIEDPSTGAILAEDNDGNGGLKSKIVFTPAISDTYIIGKASSFAPSGQTRRGWGNLKIVEYVQETPNFTMTDQPFARGYSAVRHDDHPDHAYNYRVQLRAGVTYTIETQDPVSNPGSAGTTDTYLYLADPGGSLVAEDDNGGLGLASRLVYEAPADGVYTLKLRAKDSGTSGRTTLTFTRSLTVNECAAGSDDCHPDATCTDTAESYTCQCNPGFDGDGTTCQPIICGDGLTSSGEACDGADLASETCASQGFSGGGSLSCAADCSFETSACLLGPPPMCGHWTEHERNEDGQPNTGAFIWGNDFSTLNADGPIVGCDATVELAFNDCGDEDVFQVTNDAATARPLTVWTQNHPEHYYCTSQNIQIHVRDATGQLLATYSDNCTFLDYTLNPNQTVYLHVVNKYDSYCWAPSYYLRVMFP